MKQKDILLLVVVVFISGVVSVTASKFLLGGSNKKHEQVEVVEAISSDFKQPDSKYFNKNSIDPTQVIKIGDNTNNQPFNKQ